MTSSLESQWACQQLLSRVMLLMDNREWDSLAECYTEDACLSRPTDPNNPIVGREQIRASFHARPGRTTCHCLSNCVFTQVDKNTMRVDSRVTLVSGPVGERPVQADARMLIGSFTEVMKKIEGQWLIAERTGGIDISGYG